MKKKGISLITLIITIVVVIILAAAVIIALGRNNPINDSRVAQVTQTRDSLTSGILIYATNVQSKTLGELSVKDILTSNELEYKIIVSDRSTDKVITKDGIIVTLYKLDEEKVKEKLNVDIKNQKGKWYIDQNGLAYMVYDNVESVPAYLKENNTILNSVANCVTYNNAAMTTISSNSQSGSGNESQTPVVTTYTVTYNSNGGSGTMSSSTGEIVTIAANIFTAPEGKEFDKWNTLQDGSGTSYNGGETISSNITLYAQWKNIAYQSFSIGDEVTISNNGTDETFFVIADSSSTESTIHVITKENINTTTLKQSGANTVGFADGVYWNTEQYSDANGGLNNMPPEERTCYPLEAVKAFGTQIGGNGRLLLKDEAETLAASNSGLAYANSGKYKVAGNYLNYWIGSVCDYMNIYAVLGGESRVGGMSYNSTFNVGVRPVVTISKSLVTKATE